MWKVIGCYFVFAGSIFAQGVLDQLFSAPIRDLPQRGFLGIMIENVDPTNTSLRGVIVRDVGEQTPASEAGIHTNDVIISFDTIPIRSVLQLQRVVKETPPGRTVDALVLRNQEEISLSITVGTLKHDTGFPDIDDMPFILPGRKPSQPLSPSRPTFPFEEELPEDDTVVELQPAKPVLGVLVQAMEPQLASFFGLNSDETGLLIAAVQPNSPASVAGLKAGDAILKLNETPLSTPPDLTLALDALDSPNAELDILRNRERLTVTVILQEENHP